jgi:hypothetical protein
MMATASVRSIAQTCLGRTPPLSLRRDVFGVYGANNRNRSLRAQLDLIRRLPFVRLALVTVRPLGSTLGQDANVQRDLDAANDVWQAECGTWIYCVGSVVVTTAQFGNTVVLDQPTCPLGVQSDPTDDEDALFDFGRDLGADVVGYYVGGTQRALGGCAAYPAGRRGFWVMYGTSQWMLAHELTHVIGGNPHPEDDPQVPDNDQDNLMWNTPGRITHPPPDLRAVQCDRIHGNGDIEAC